MPPQSSVRANGQTEHSLVGTEEYTVTETKLSLDVNHNAAIEFMLNLTY